MFMSSTNSSRIRSKSLSKYRCQASALALNRIFQKIFSTVMADRRRSLTPRVLHPSPAFCRAGHAPWTSWRRSSALKPPRACPNTLAAPFASPSSFLRAHGDQNTKHRRANSTQTQAPLPDSSKPQLLRESLHVPDPTATPFFASGSSHRERGSTGSP